ncbi:AAA family ATPase [Bacteroides sp. ET71]|uniref:AAA family ATPase n=1 Tax=Bacteroides sp. ET71 TaxID=2939421 RepID=UPI00201399BC|nr:AAA family ATPase [Bacteroides sp. ET71]MCL1615487.1 AAA family ATPase [Bacteroides sp. ET71]
MKEYKNNTVFEYSTLNEIVEYGMKAEKREYLYKNLWIEKELTVFFGTANVGKSMIAVQIAEEIAKKGKKVMYFDYELSEQQLSDRYETEDGARHYVFSENLLRPNLDMDKYSPSYKERLEKLFRRIEEATKLGIKIFIVDNITYLNPNLQKGNEAAKFIINFKSKMEMLGISVLLLGHSPKAKDNAILTLDKLSGSKNLSNFIDSCFAVGKVEGERKVYLKQLKARSCAISMDENHVLVGALTKREDGFIEFAEEGYAVEKELLKGKADITPLKEQAYRLYKEGKKFREIGRKIGVSDKTAKAWVLDYMAYFMEKADNSLENKEIDLKNDNN